MIPGLQIIDIRDQRYVLAYWNDVRQQWEAPMTKAAKKSTGCQAIFSNDKRTIVNSPCVKRYTTYQGAERARKRIEGDVVRHDPSRSRKATILDSLPRLPQRQDSLAAQLQDLIHVAHRLGMYDAADIITRTLVERIP